MRAANTNQPIENRLTFNRPTCYSRLADFTCTTKLINTAAGHIWTFAHYGVKHNDFCCFKGVTYMSPLQCVIN